MTLSRGIAGQLALPHGTAGRWLGKVMDVANRKPTRLAIDLLAPQAGENILDAGCGTGAAMAAILRRTPCHVTGIDPSPVMLRSAARGLRAHLQAGHAELHRTAIETMGFADGSFHAALALNVLYFCDADGAMLGRLARSLRPGGRIVAYVTHRDSMANWPFAQQGLHRLFDHDDLFRLFVKAGFDPGRIAVHEVAITRSVMGLLASAER